MNLWVKRIALQCVVLLAVTADWTETAGRGCSAAKLLLTLCCPHLHRGPLISEHSHLQVLPPQPALQWSTACLGLTAQLGEVLLPTYVHATSTCEITESDSDLV